jgi:hypothetical protein
MIEKKIGIDTYINDKDPRTLLPEYLCIFKTFINAGYFMKSECFMKILERWRDITEISTCETWLSSNVDRKFPSALEILQSDVFDKYHGKPDDDSIISNITYTL